MEEDKQLKPILLDSVSVGEDLALVEQLFSRINVDSGTLWTTEAAKRLANKGLQQNIIHSLLIRSLFILFLEDKGASEKAGLYESIKPGSKSYFDILKDKDATYLL